MSILRDIMRTCPCAEYVGIQGIFLGGLAVEPMLASKIAHNGLCLHDVHAINAEERNLIEFQKAIVAEIRLVYDYCNTY